MDIKEEIVNTVSERVRIRKIYNMNGADAEVVTGEKEKKRESRETFKQSKQQKYSIRRQKKKTSD